MSIERDWPVKLNDVVICLVHKTFLALDGRRLRLPLRWNYGTISERSASSSSASRQKSSKLERSLHATSALSLHSSRAAVVDEAA